MKLSTNFLKDYLDIDINSKEDVHKLAEDMTKVGNEYDSEGMLIEATNLVIGEVLECEKHPDSDHLHICKVNIGKETSQIVCGAPNVRKGLKVIVALPGAKLPGGEIKKSVIRGQESNGMLCSIAELGIESKFLKEEDKAGIHELDKEAPVGKDPIEYMHMKDGVIDFELTANRGDLLSILGMANEVGAIYNKKVKSIDLTHKENGNLDFKLNIATDNCTLFLAKKVENVKIQESPQEIKEKLMASGIRPINNVVDISNYVMLETGQPLHFYDADKLQGMLEVRMAKVGEKLVTLDKQERTLGVDDIVISDGKRAIGLAGVMGGYDTEITENTKNIIIESAIFNSVKIRRTSNKILRSEASNRFEKGLDPNRTYMAIERSCNLLEKYAGATVIGGMEVYDKTNKEDKKIDITVENINSLLGSSLTEKEIIDIFERLGFKVEKKNSIKKGIIEANGKDARVNDKAQINPETLTVYVPTRRLDISIKEDLIEEVGRIYGVDNIQGRLKEMTIKKGSYDRTTREIRNKMINLGMNETLTYSLVSEKEANMFTNKTNEVIKILAPLTEERNALRQSLITSLLKTYEYNASRDNKDVCLFEIAKAFYIENNEKDNLKGKKVEGENKFAKAEGTSGEYKEENRLACLMTGEYYLGLKTKQVDFYIIKGICEELLDYLGYAGRYSFIADKEKLPEEMHPGKSAVISVNGEIVGLIGRVTPELCKEEVYVMEISLDKLLSKKVGKMKYKELSKFPVVKKDIAVLVNKEVPAQELLKTIKNNGGKLLQESKVFDLYEGKGVPEGKKSIAFSITLGDANKTLTDEEVNKIMEKIIVGLQSKHNAELRK